MAARKTIKVVDVKKELNDKLTNPDIGMAEKRIVTTLIETFLMATDNYRGFSFLSKTAMPGDDDYYDRYYY